MRFSSLITSSLAIAAILAAAPAGAELYKWVDEHGVTNYSNQPPPDPAAVSRFATVEDRLSVYTPDRALTQAVDAFRKGADRTAADRVRALEEQLAAERRARQQSAATVRASTVDACAGGFGINCNSYYPYVPPVVLVPVHHRPRKLHSIHLPVGATAGNVVGMNGFIPGNSASAPRPAAPPPRVLLEAMPARGSAAR